MARFDRERKRVLLVEDHEDTWELMEYCLTEYEIVCARDFDEGLRLAQRLTSPVGEIDTAAWRAELAAIREELAIKQMENADGKCRAV